MRTLQGRGHAIHFLWALGHAGIAGNEHADALARATATSTSLCPVAWGVSRSLVEHRLWHWFQERAIQQERTLASADSAPGEDHIIRSDLQWLEPMPSRFMAAQVG